ncbi:AIM24 family protein [Paenibacillus sp. YYML68]|uniref:AIM24 family protein n=1 Tax=Paenibacillus sp. YYML68 TaxID=2909250 RepID=UPI00249353B1|nr:AIM24 family protein [Paenibacillus sp. YYML68]
MNIQTETRTRTLIPSLAPQASAAEAGAEGQAAVVELAEGETAHVLHPSRIIAFEGESRAREDRFLNLSGMYRKKSWVESRITGEARFVLGLPAGVWFKALELPDHSNLLFDIRHVLLYDGSMKLESRLQKAKQALVTRDWVRMKFSGGGLLGLAASGPLYELSLDTARPVYVDAGCLVAFPEDASMRLSVYGNTLASQRMNYQWEMTGKGKVLIQPSPHDRVFTEGMRQDSLLRRMLREVLPFGGVFIK